MNQTMGISAAVCQWLTEREIPAVEGWLSEPRNKAEGPIVVVTVREYTAQNAGFEHYLGERYNEDTAVWEECYGRKAEVELGLDLVAPETCDQESLNRLMEQLAGVLAVEAPEGLQVNSLSCEAPVWDEKQRCLRQPVSAVCTAWLLALHQEETAFLDFELRGGWKH
mgnify:CR=1 FL=1